jgi:hypothetical protein
MGLTLEDAERVLRRRGAERGRRAELPNLLDHLTAALQARGYSAARAREIAADAVEGWSQPGADDHGISPELHIASRLAHHGAPARVLPQTLAEALTHLDAVS